MDELKRTELSTQLREYAANTRYSLTGDTFALFAAAADEIDRYYTGMLNWKATAEAQSRPSNAASAQAADRADAFELAAQTCDQQGDGTNGAYRSACLQCANAVRELRDAVAYLKTSEVD